MECSQTVFPGDHASVRQAIPRMEQWHFYCDYHTRSWENTESQGNIVHVQKTPLSVRVGHFLSYTMSDSNRTDFTNPSTFILLGIPGLEVAHIWISIPFCAMYTIAILLNSTILFIVKMEPNLHGPMFYFLCMLAISDLVMSTSTMYSVHSFSGIESGILVAMSLDRYVAICHPVRHSATLTNSVVVTIVLAVVLHRGILTLRYPFLVRRWPYCRTNIIPHFYCRHVAVVNLACSDIRVSSYYGLFNLYSVIGIDVFFISVSYTQILRAIFRLPTKDARFKTFGTCISHLCAISTLCIPDLFSSLMHRFGQNTPLQFFVLIASVYYLVPPVLHPIIYRVRTKQIRDRLLHLFTNKKT
ncbi:olfactory receptor 52E4-like [Mauremys mutica]|uniref:olfactory receptor 52E4-like n=1 Tax=Mauremys mutica TaxID=74926 RepID=UPI001D14FFDA|nr:olfactory receptor 52E4-like [Mauremys mutica]